MRFTLKNLRFLQYIDYQNVRKTEFLGCQSQENIRNHLSAIGADDCLRAEQEDFRNGDGQ